MSKWVKYYLLSALSVIVISAICLFVAGRLPTDVSEFSNVLINMIYWAVMILCLLQTGILLISHYKRLYPRFFISFTGIYALLFLILYSMTVKAHFSTWNMYKKFMGNPPGLEGFDLTSCFIGDHTWFLVPAVLQVLMWILLRRQQKQAASKVIG